MNSYTSQITKGISILGNDGVVPGDVEKIIVDQVGRVYPVET